MSTFFERLEEARKAHGEYTQDKLAEKIAYTRGAYNGWRTGHLPRRPVIERLAQILNVDADWLGRVPAQGRTLKHVHGLALPGQPGVQLDAGTDVELSINPHGAASAWVVDSAGDVVLLGLKPDEFEITAWYAEGRLQVAAFIRPTKESTVDSDD